MDFLNNFLQNFKNSAFEANTEGKPGSVDVLPISWGQFSPEISKQLNFSHFKELAYSTTKMMIRRPV